MLHNILITGASGYLGGSLLARWGSAGLPSFEHLYALVRTNSQAEAVKQYGAEPLTFNVRDEKEAYAAITDNKITIVYFLIDAMQSDSQIHIIKALAQVKKTTGMDVHFLHTSGAKLFSSHAGAPVDRPLLDNETDLYDIQKKQIPRLPAFQSAIDANNSVIEQAESLGVRSYVFVPCIVYGRGEGFGNITSIQTVAIIRAAKALGRIHSVDSGRPVWPVCHIKDTSDLYLELMRNILAGSSPPSGKNGYYLAASGNVAWMDIYEAFAAALTKRGVIADPKVTRASDQDVKEMAAALGSPGAPKEIVELQLGGQCTFTAERGASIGWKPHCTSKHLIEVADEEVQLVLDNLDK